MPATNHADWPPTREEGLRRLADFLPRAGWDYAERRNFDLGPGDRSNVSTLSPYLRHRLLTEDEVVSATLLSQGLKASEKFVGETCWRTYWKGWLELRPSVWDRYQAEVLGLLDTLDRDAGLRDRYESACSGRSGIGCVDLWARELVESGYLHNHARMWFASIWIFTLRLPWALGADFFLRHLIDGDPASNTLSWRWVAGLQTKGKTYLATASNIARFTEGRVVPREPLASRAEPIEGEPLPAWEPLPRAREIDATRPFALVLTEDDLAVESIDLVGSVPVAVAGVLATEDRSPRGVNPIVLRFADGAMSDALDRASRRFGCPAIRLEGDRPEELNDWCDSGKVDQLVTPFAPVGPARSRLDRLESVLVRSGRTLIRPRGAWDEALWPHATSGYFGFKKKLDVSLARLGITDRSS
ncbi:FAD-binding domain-containing protein [Tundrisphaera lichenicola]|uniref:FAD-binding domain-containing protein n=1 Tax=Tundrisphaera lichenicola TaxID=2029860 RepID=UPI003EBF085A